MTHDRPPLLSVVLVGALCVFLCFLFLADLFFTPEVQREWWWAGFQLYSFPVPYRIVAALAPVIVLLMPWRHLEETGLLLQRWCRAAWNAAPYPPVWVGVLILLLWLFRNSNLVVGDMAFYAAVLIPVEGLSERGVFINYESIGTTLLYSRGFHYAHHLFHFGALEWYQFSGTICLLLFLGWVWMQRGRGIALFAPAALAVILSGNWTQSTLGAPEHYGQVLLLIVAFAALGVEALRGRAPLWQACLAYAAGAFFHLMIAWIFPALLWLIWKRWRSESPAGRQAVICALFIPAFFAGYLCYWYGFDITFLAQGHGAGGKLIPMMDPNDPHYGVFYHYSTFDIRHLLHILQEMMVMGWPGMLLLAGAAPMLSRARLRHDPAIGFLVVLFLGTFALNLLWNPDLGFWRDQDLFAIIGVALCLLGAWVVSGPQSERWDPALRRRLLAAAIVGAIAWRLPVMIWHGPMSVNFFDPELLYLEYPFPDLESQSMALDK